MYVHTSDEDDDKEAHYARPWPTNLHIHPSIMTPNLSFRSTIKNIYKKYFATFIDDPPNLSPVVVFGEIRMLRFVGRYNTIASECRE